jgi:DivIVA domain-containing protein
MGKKDKHTGEASAAPSSRLTPMDIQQKEFRVSRFGGYKMRDVDEFLDQITDTFSAMSAEIDRLRAGGAAPVVGSPDLDDVSRQADEIIARARAEATRITAEARAAASGGGEGGSTDRSAVNAFIVREREFLQSLAGLVQEHAETVKDMAKSSKRPQAAASTATESPATSAAPAASAASASASTAEPEASSPASAPRPTSGEQPKPADETTPSRASGGEDTVRIEEPATAGARADRETEGDRSLRDLFWGED